MNNSITNTQAKNMKKLTLWLISNGYQSKHSWLSETCTDKTAVYDCSRRYTLIYKEARLPKFTIYDWNKNGSGSFDVVYKCNNYEQFIDFLTKNDLRDKIEGDE